MQLAQYGCDGIYYIGGMHLLASSYFGHDAAGRWGCEAGIPVASAGTHRAFCGSGGKPVECETMINVATSLLL